MRSSTIGLRPAATIATFSGLASTPITVCHGREGGGRDDPDVAESEDGESHADVPQPARDGSRS
jgi:hypothetical protein